MLETRPRWTAALPVMAALLVVGVAAALISPTFRHQLGLSFHRQPTHYVELYFADQSQARNCPVGADGALTVVATVRSHLADPTALPYRVDVTATDGTTVTRTGVVATTPGQPADFGASVAAPATPYTVQVQLTGRTERLVLHCGGGS